jgi:hypothetical protein
MFRSGTNNQLIVQVKRIVIFTSVLGAIFASPYLVEWEKSTIHTYDDSASIMHNYNAQTLRVSAHRVEMSWATQTWATQTSPKEINRAKTTTQIQERPDMNSRRLQLVSR